MLRKNRRKQEKALEYATRSDFQQIFTEDMAGLHLLALLLTADPGKAERCFVAGLEESVGDNSVFRQWARSWSKRAIIKNAIKALRPRPASPGLASDAAAHSAAYNTGARDAGEGREDRPANNLVAAVTALSPFERFVLVMAVLEGYSPKECAALLGCPVRSVARARSQALQGLGLQPAGAPADRRDRTISWASFLRPTQLA
jgi:DNA-directed RNA polymerase specialized sigma24 family protein